MKNYLKKTLSVVALTFGLQAAAQPDTIVITMEEEGVASAVLSHNFGNLFEKNDSEQPFQGGNDTGNYCGSHVLDNFFPNLVCPNRYELQYTKPLHFMNPSNCPEEILDTEDYRNSGHIWGQKIISTIPFVVSYNGQDLSANVTLVTLDQASNVARQIVADSGLRYAIIENEEGFSEEDPNDRYYLPPTHCYEIPQMSVVSKILNPNGTLKSMTLLKSGVNAYDVPSHRSSWVTAAYMKIDAVPDSPAHAQ